MLRAQLCQVAAAAGAEAQGQEEGGEQPGGGASLPETPAYLQAEGTASGEVRAAQPGVMDTGGLLARQPQCHSYSGRGTGGTRGRGGGTEVHAGAGAE